MSQSAQASGAAGSARCAEVALEGFEKGSDELARHPRKPTACERGHPRTVADGVEAKARMPDID